MPFWGFFGQRSSVEVGGRVPPKRTKHATTVFQSFPSGFSSSTENLVGQSVKLKLKLLPSSSFPPKLLLLTVNLKMQKSDNPKLDPSNRTLNNQKNSAKSSDVTYF